MLNLIASHLNVVFGFMQIFEHAFSEHNTLHFQKCSLDNQVQQLEQHVFSSCQKRYHGRNSPLQATPQLKSHIKYVSETL